MTLDTSCLNCKHLNKDLYTCKAFPKGILIEIVSGELTHFREIEGDNGYQFQPKEIEEET
jgi:hypothetical protein